MRIAEIVGKVVLSKVNPHVANSTWLIGVPLNHAGLNGDPAGRGEPLVMLDERGAGNGSIVAFSEGGEAAAPFHPNEKPIDAYCSAILDNLDVDPSPKSKAEKETHGRQRTLFDGPARKK
ncbi:MAG: carbon dioxide concentrating mechanism protein CcmL [Planctomycetaceae bacterium]|nr:carbon dioxide concentrating mechanism protein CcmL [Planctomycetaceae bacterium]